MAQRSHERNGITGTTKTTEYRSWQHMKSRCSNPNYPNYHNYGGRGISVCDAWRRSFNAFLSDVGPRPSAIHTIDRIDPNGDYEPGNVRWATHTEQQNNRRNNINVTYLSKPMTLADAVRAAGSIVSHGDAWRRITRRGWEVQRALETPSSKYRRRSVEGWS